MREVLSLWIVLACADGFYRFHLPKPIDLNLNAFELPESVGSAPALIQGRVRGEAQLVGTIFPLLIVFVVRSFPCLS